jgi:hypothetical protein
VLVGALSFDLSGSPSSEQFGIKNVAGVDAFGVTGGPSGNEIDLGQSITFENFSLPVSLSSFTLAFLFDGPEFDDVQEVAQVTITLPDTTTQTGTLTANFTGVGGPFSATWSLPLPAGTVITPVSPPGGNPTSDGAAVWTVSNPFGNTLISSIAFTPLLGIGAAPCGSPGNAANCTNQSDFGIVEVQVAVPEPAMLALLGSGLIGLGAMLRRRRDA